ncbi:integrase core domain-containing protein [Arcticibacter sp.]|uniref:integrase core domain-containing protein n=1 Tax=Arcticibacter sp. TaxID=1872630 RepID=UPI0038908297
MPYALIPNAPLFIIPTEEFSTVVIPTCTFEKARIQISMTQSGSPYDNAVAERINGILKNEFGLNSVFQSYTTAVDNLPGNSPLQLFETPI